ncbi:MAG: hypothetical protein V4598_15430 [Bdellovibrionota bacterium]
MKFFQAVLLASFLFSSFAMGDENVSPDCEQQQTSPLTQNPLEGIAPNCLADRPASFDPVMIFQTDQRVCNCIDRFPLATLMASQPTPVEEVPVEEIPDVLPQTEEEIADPEGIDPKMVNQHCVARREFDSHLAMPIDEEFFKSIPETFNASDWTMEGLVREYDSGTAATRAKVVSRMSFLNRNPTVRGLLEAFPTERFPNVRVKQAELFAILRRLAPATGSNCSSTPHGCWEEMHRSGAYNSFREDLANFLDSEDVARGLGAFMMENGSASIRADREDERLGRPNLNTPADLYINTNIASPALNGCTGKDATPDCYSLFPDYCRKVRTVAERMARNEPLNGRSMFNQLDYQDSRNASYEGYDNFNNLICNTPYQNASGQSATFFQFRAQQCPANQSSNPVCSDRNQLLSQYFSQYPRPEDDAAFPRTVFMRSLTSNPVIAAVEARLYNANLIVRSSSDKFANILGKSPAAISSARLQTLITAANTSSGRSQGRTSGSTSSAASFSPGFVAPVNPIGQSSAVIPSRVRRDYVSDESRTPDADTYRSSATREYYRPFDTDTSFYDNTPLRRPADERRNFNQNSDANPEQPFIPQQAQNISPPSSGGSVERSSASVSGGGRLPSGGGSSSSAAAPEAVRGNSSGGRRSLIEVTPRRSSGNRSGRVPASGSQDQTTPQNFDFRPVIPVEINQSLLKTALTNPQVLANDQSIMEKVNSSTEQVVRLGLRVAGSNEDTVVYAIKEASGVRFSLVPPTATTQRIAPTLRDNEMNLRVVDQIAYTEIRRNPASLLQNDELLRTARTFSGDVIRIYMYSPEGQRTEMFFNKRLNDVTLRN